MERPRLYMHEWLAIVAIAGFMIMVCSLAQFNTMRTRPSKVISELPMYVGDPYVWLTVEGAVENPGKIRLSRNAKMEDVFKIAKPLPEADLSKFDFSKSINRKRIVKVPKISKEKKQKFKKGVVEN